VIRHMWFTLDFKMHRDIVLRIFWDGEKTPSVECPIGDFFCCSGRRPREHPRRADQREPGRRPQLLLPHAVREARADHVQNDSPNDLRSLYYTINYTLEAARRNALRFTRVAPDEPRSYGEFYTMVEGVKGGASTWALPVVAAEQLRLVGRGRDPDVPRRRDAYPTIAGTGTEDYFGGAWGFERKGYSESFSAPYSATRTSSRRWCPATRA